MPEELLYRLPLCFLAPVNLTHELSKGLGTQLSGRALAHHPQSLEFDPQLWKTNDKNHFRMR